MFIIKIAWLVEKLSLKVKPFLRLISSNTFINIQYIQHIDTEACVPNGTYINKDSIMCTNKPDGSTEKSVIFSALSPIKSLQSITWDKVRMATNSNEYLVKLVDIIESVMPELRHSHYENTINFVRICTQLMGPS